MVQLAHRNPEKQNKMKNSVLNQSLKLNLSLQYETLLLYTVLSVLGAFFSSRE